MYPDWEFSDQSNFSLIPLYSRGDELVEDNYCLLYEKVESILKNPPAEFSDELKEVASIFSGSELAKRISKRQN